jgi:NitT/TauT family transport system permease protein
MTASAGTERAPPRAIIALTRAIRWRTGWPDLAALLLLGLVLYGVAKVGVEWHAPLRAQVDISLKLRTLPLYTFFSLCRGMIAFAVSFLFTLVYGYVAARVRYADRVMLPLIDILQSIPVLGFMPGIVLALATLFPHTNTGLELAAILMIFTAQVWNMTFSFYHSLRAIPEDLMEAGRIYRFGWWRRFKRIELPSSTVGLVWNGMMSMAGGWFFLTINEAFRLGDHDFRLPGVGAYMSVAIDRGDRGAMVAAVVAMTVMIVVVDQLFWRPLVAWAERFKLEDVGGTSVNTSWVLKLLRRSQLYAAVQRFFERRQRAAEERQTGRAREPVLERLGPRARGTVVFTLVVAVLAALGAASVWGTVKLAMLLAKVHGAAWREIGRDTAFTFLRTSAAVILGSLWAIPAGVYIGTHPRAARVLQPLVQIAASFPAPMLFPLVLAVMASAALPLGIGSVVLMMLGTQWYILFNVIAGAMSIPNELQEAARVYRFSRAQKWRRLYLPGVFPQLVTGWVTAAGGAWNASIVAEFIQASGTIRTTPGLGSLISLSAAHGDFPVLTAGVLTMAATVVTVNRLFWKRLYNLAERRYALSR